MRQLNSVGKSCDPDAADSPILYYSDALAALVYYRDLGFEVHLDGDDAVVRLQGVRIRLRKASPERSAARGGGARRADASIEVDRPYRLLRQVGDRAPRSVLPGGTGFRDHEGNVISVAPTRGPAGAARRLLWPPVLDEMRTRCRAWRSRRVEAPYLRSFRDFYRRLPDRQDVFYMYLPTGSLHWAAKSLSLVPREVNLVLISSALSADERSWLRERVRHAHFAVDLRIDEVTAWEFAFATNEEGFGWLAPQCLVLDAGLFAELTRIADDRCVNGIWWGESGLGARLARPDFQFVNVNVVRALRDAGLAVGPNWHSVPPFPRANRQVPGRRCYGEVVGRKPRERLAELAAAQGADTDDRAPDIVARLFDTTYLHQAIARSLGFVAGAVRDLRWDDGAHAAEASDEVVHASSIGRGPHPESDDLSGLLRDHVGLLGAHELPQVYRDRQEVVVARLARVGRTPAAATEAVADRLVSEQGLSERAVDVVLRPSVGASAGDQERDFA